MHTYIYIYIYIYICALFVLGSDLTCDMSYCIVCSFLLFCIHACVPLFQYLLADIWLIFGLVQYASFDQETDVYQMYVKSLTRICPLMVYIYADEMKWLQDLNGIRPLYYIFCVAFIDLDFTLKCLFPFQYNLGISGHYFVGTARVD